MDPHLGQGSQVDSGIPAQIVGYSVAADGSLTDLRTIASQEHEVSRLYLIEGTCTNLTKRFLNDYLRNMPDAFFDVHLADTLSRIEHDIDGTRMFIAKWSRVANQPQVAWAREKRLRDGNPFDVHHQDPAAARLDHEELVHSSEPYRPYDPIFEYTEKRQTKEDKPRRAVGAPGKTGDGEAEERTAQDDPERLSRARHKFRLSRAAFTGSDIASAEPTMKDFPLIRHAVRDSVSIYQGENSRSGKQIVVILFDPIHRRKRISVKYNLWIGGDPSRDATNEECFENEDATLQRFVTLMKESPPDAKLVPLATRTRKAVMSLVLADEARLMGAIGRALDEMELAMASKTYERWRNYAPAWRNHLYHQLDTLTYFSDVLTDTMVSTDENQNSESPSSKTSDAVLLLRVQTIRARMEALSRRLDSSFQTLTSTMSIIESEKAIQEAEEVTRLTNLAFFFIPLSLVASVFGMNVIEFDQRLTSWMWVAASLLVTILTYSIRFRRPLSRTIMSTPSAVRTLPRDVAFVLTRRVAQFVRSWIGLVFNLCFTVGFEAGLWLVAKHPSLTSDARIGIGTALGVLPPTYLFLKTIQTDGFKDPKNLPQFIQFFLVVAAVGVALWKLSTTHALETNEKIGVALGIFGIQFFTMYPSSVPVMLISILDCPDKKAFYPGVVKRIVPRSLQLIIRLTLWTIQGVVLWKLFVSTTVAESAKIGVAIGIVGAFPILAVIFFVDRSDGGPWPFRQGGWLFTKTFADRFGTDLLLMGAAAMMSPAVWKLATSQLSDGEKISIGIGTICAPWSFFLIVST